MCVFKGYYHSPIGIIEICSNGEAVTGTAFVEKEDAQARGDSIVRKCTTQLDEYFKGSRTCFDIPLQLNGTDFQKRVWKLLTEIDYGKTASYQDIALKIGNPDACRAVGAAIGKNPVFLMVPCHRVIGKNGDLTGFACGLERKKWLLEHEKRGA